MLASPGRFSQFQCIGLLTMLRVLCASSCVCGCCQQPMLRQHLVTKRSGSYSSGYTVSFSAVYPYGHATKFLFLLSFVRWTIRITARSLVCSPTHFSVFDRVTALHKFYFCISVSFIVGYFSCLSITSGSVDTSGWWESIFFFPRPFGVRLCIFGVTQFGLHYFAPCAWWLSFMCSPFPFDSVSYSSYTGVLVVKKCRRCTINW